MPPSTDEDSARAPGEHQRVGPAHVPCPGHAGRAGGEPPGADTLQFNRAADVKAGGQVTRSPQPVSPGGAPIMPPVEGADSLEVERENRCAAAEQNLARLED